MSLIMEVFNGKCVSTDGEGWKMKKEGGVRECETRCYTTARDVEVKRCLCGS